MINEEKSDFRTVAWVTFNVIFAIAMLASKNPDLHMWSVPLLINCVIIVITKANSE